MAVRKHNKKKLSRMRRNRLPLQTGNNGCLQQMRNLRVDLDEVKQRLVDYGADAAFDTVVSGSCDPTHLLVLLAGLTSDGSSLNAWELFGFPPRQLRSVARRMRQCAKDIEVLDRNKMLRLMLWPKFSGKLSMEQFFDRVASLPTLMRESADTMDDVSRNSQIAPRALNPFNIALAQLVAYVQRYTGKPNDDHVSAMVNAACKRSFGRPYTADALKVWRNGHSDLIRDLGEALSLRFDR